VFTLKTVPPIKALTLLINAGFDQSLNNYQADSMRILAPCIFILLLGLPLNKTLAQTETKTAVEVSASSNDLVGQRLVYQIKEGIRKSSNMRLTYDDESRLQLLIITLERDQINPGSSTIYSITWTYKMKGELLPYFVDNVLGTVGSMHVQEVADDKVAKTDDELERLMTFLKSIKQ